MSENNPADTPREPDTERVSELRRRVLQALAAAAVGVTILPSAWTKPIVGSIIVPAHAAVSPASPTPGLSVSSTETPTPTASSSMTPTPTVSRSVTPTPTVSLTPTPTVSQSLTPTPSPSLSFGLTPTPTPSPTRPGDARGGRGGVGPLGIRR